MDKYLNDETVWGQGSSVWLWPFTSNLASTQWKPIGRQPPRSSQSLLLYVEVWLGQWLMTASGRKQSTTRLISSPPAPVATLEENGKEWTQHTRLDNGKEQQDGKGKRKKKERIKGKSYWPLHWVAHMWLKNTHPWIHFWKRITHLCTPKEHVTFEIKIIPKKPTGICLLLPKWPQCKLAGSFHVRRERAACGLTPWLIWQTEWTLQASVLLTSRPTVPCCIGVDIYETCQRGLLDLANESRLKPTAARAAWHCHPEAVPVTAAVSWWLITMFTLVPLLWAFDRCAENITGISAEKEKLINFWWLLYIMSPSSYLWPCVIWAVTLSHCVDFTVRHRLPFQVSVSHWLAGTAAEGLPPHYHTRLILYVHNPTCTHSFITPSDLLVFIKVRPVNKEIL